jgi:rhodanese-related sulfurtransferase
MHVDAREAGQRFDEFFVLDVREASEWARGRADGSVHIPMAELGPRQSELPSDRPILCVCRSGSRSAFVTKALRDAGYSAENLDGGLKGWAAAGLPLVVDDGGPGVVA